MRSRCFRKPSSSSPIRSPWRGGCAGFISGRSAGQTWRSNTGSGCSRPSPVIARRCRSWWNTTGENDPAGAESLLNEVLANPKLDRHAFGRLLAQSELGRLYSGRLHQTEKAADAFAKVLEGLDDKSANRLTPTDQFRILGNNPAMAYFNFGMVFLAAKRNELAVKALEHGLVYDEDNTQISLLAGRHFAEAQPGTAGPCAG